MIVHQAGQGSSGGGGSSGGEGQKEEAGCDLTRPEYSTGQGTVPALCSSAGIISIDCKDRAGG